MQSLLLTWVDIEPLELIDIPVAFATEGLSELHERFSSVRLSGLTANDSVSVSPAARAVAVFAKIISVIAEQIINKLPLPS